MLVRSYKRDLDDNLPVLLDIQRELANREYRVTEVRLLDLLEQCSPAKWMLPCLIFS